MSKTLVLYQKYPGRAHTFHHTTEMFEPTSVIYSFPATKAGIDAAIEKAERGDAKLVILDKPYFEGAEFKRDVEELIRKKKFIPVFQTAKGVREVLDA